MENFAKDFFPYNDKDNSLGSGKISSSKTDEFPEEEKTEKQLLTEEKENGK